VGIIENFKDVLKLADAANNLDLYKKLAELQNSVLGLQEENRELKDQLARLADQLSTHRTLRHDGERYWSEQDGKRDGPFCAVCWDIDKKLVRMREYHRDSGAPGYVCDFCARHRGKTGA
jgi:hypothetical protein